MVAEVALPPTLLVVLARLEKVAGLFGICYSSIWGIGGL